MAERRIKFIIIIIIKFRMFKLNTLYVWCIIKLINLDYKAF